MPKGEFIKQYWNYRKNGGQLDLKNWNINRKQKSESESPHPNSEGVEDVASNDNRKATVH